MSQFGITSWFIPDIISALPYNSRFVCDVASGIRDDARNKLPLTLGLITIERSTSNRYRVMFNYSSSVAVGQLYIASIDMENKVVNKWYQVNVTAV